MNLFRTHRPRIFLVSGALIVVTLIGFIFARQMASVHAAKRAVLAEDARVATELAANPTPRSGATPVLVELFTSEGCSSCPPADALLAQLDRTQPVAHADIIALEEHVDYWDSLGWKDRFSSHQLTDRQSTYAQHLHLDDDYTPQMIVDGTDQFVGNDTAHAFRAIAQATQTPKLALSLSQPTFSDGHIAATAALAQAPTPASDADVFAVLVEPMASSQVLRGENGGRTLQHASVVRELQRVGSLADLASSPLKVSLDVPKDASANLRVVVFVQRTGQGAVLGSASSPTATSISSTSNAAAE